MIKKIKKINISITHGEDTILKNACSNNCEASDFIRKAITNAFDNEEKLADYIEQRNLEKYENVSVHSGILNQLESIISADKLKAKVVFDSNDTAVKFKIGTLCKIDYDNNKAIFGVKSNKFMFSLNIKEIESIQVCGFNDSLSSYKPPEYLKSFEYYYIYINH